MQLTLLDSKNLEEEIKNVIIEMKKACLLELRKQNFVINNLEKNEINNIKERNSSKSLYNSYNGHNNSKQ